MKYPENLKNIIDVTKAPYYADNTGKTDCTDILRRIIDDLMLREIKGIKETESRLHTLGENDVYIGFESRIENNLIRVIFPEYVPDARIVYFPKGIYSVSDTVTYTHSNLKNIFDSKPGFEMTRGIHFLGDGTGETVIKLKDNCNGFEEGSKKPVLSLINAKGCLEIETSNVSQLNTISGLTVDCGSGNAGAVGIRFIANNSGRIENVCVKGVKSDTGIQLAVGTEGVFKNISVIGFKTGVYAYKTSVCVFDGFNFENVMGDTVCTGNGSAVFTGFTSGDFNKIKFIKENGNYVIAHQNENTKFGGNKVYSVDTCGCIYENNRYIGKSDIENNLAIPEDELNLTKDNYTVVEDYGAISDGKTDSTSAIQKAFDSGKEIILFSGGHYLVDGNITIPKSVKKIDFMFCDFFAGKNLISGGTDALFTVIEDSDLPLRIENLYTFEQFYGHFRLICHAAKRDLILKDLHTQTAAMYFNTVAGSRVYIDNCACTVGTYSNDCIIARKGFEPEFCSMIPFEFHEQKVTAFNLNPERADVEVLNDNSELMVYGFKVEGPGTAVKTENGGKTAIIVYSCGIGDITAKNALFQNNNSDIYLIGGKIFGVSDELDYNLILNSRKGEQHNKVYKCELAAITKYRVDYSVIDKR
ncbi:MAG: hypothetical protein IJT84_05500 [Clostridia bacterium]|nr:hypothetical protein [Clostridia bacterium]